MEYAFKLPDLAEGMVEGELVAWLVAVGDAVKVEQPVAEVMTDKATVVIPSPVEGVIQALPWAPGDIVKVGATLITFDARGAIPEQRAHSGHVNPAETPAPVEAAPAPVAPAAPVGGTPAPEVPLAGVPSARSLPEIPRGSRALATPATRRAARELGLDIGTIVGSGPGGRVLAEDVTRAAQAPSAPSAPPAPPAAPRPAASQAPASSAPAGPAPTPRVSGERSETREKIRGLRRAIFEAMARSKRLAAHFTYIEEVDCERLVEARTRLAKVAESKGIKLTYLAFIAKATALALARFPKMNASIDDERQEVIYRNYVHLGIAAATDPGLVVPTIRDADRLSLLDLAWHIQALGDRAKQNRLRPDELKGSTFTISSLGKLGGLLATPIINHPEVAIMGVHQMQKRAVVQESDKGDVIVVRQRMNLSLAFDHRLIDGHEGAAFTQAVKAYLEDPDLMLLETV